MSRSLVLQQCIVALILGSSMRTVNALITLIALVVVLVMVTQQGWGGGGGCEACWCDGRIMLLIMVADTDFYGCHSGF